MGQEFGTEVVIIYLSMPFTKLYENYITNTSSCMICVAERWDEGTSILPLFFTEIIDIIEYISDSIPHLSMDIIEYTSEINQIASLIFTV